MAANSESAQLDLSALVQELDALTDVNQARGPVVVEPADSVLTLLRKALAL